MVTSGFFNSVNHDRKYNALQFGSIFDGIVRDGVFMSIGSCFRVIPNDGMTLTVGSGRAWFDHTWTLNDAPIPIELPQSELLLKRIDAIVIDVNQYNDVRNNDIIVVKGTPSSNPQRPTLINETKRHQYPLAYISVRPEVTSIRAADIENVVGTSATPYVTGILETVNIDALLDQWKDQWNEFFEDQTAEMEETNALWKKQWSDWFEAQTKEIQDAYLAWESEWNLWFETYQSMMNATADEWKTLWNSWFYYYTNQSKNGLSTWIENTENDFNSWWDSIKDVLNESCCANLTQRIVELEKKNAELEEFRDNIVNKQEIDSPIYDTLYNRFLANITNQDNVEITNHENALIGAVGETHEPILDDEMKPISSVLKIAIL